METEVEFGQEEPRERGKMVPRKEPETSRGRGASGSGSHFIFLIGICFPQLILKSYFAER